MLSKRLNIAKIDYKGLAWFSREITEAVTGGVLMKEVFRKFILYYLKDTHLRKRAIFIKWQVEKEFSS